MTELYARIAGGIVAEIIALPEGLALADILHPDLASACLPCGAEVREGWLAADGAFLPPPSAPLPPTEAEAKAECARRINAAASLAAQLNLNAYMNVLNAKTSPTAEEQADLAAFGQAVGWIAAMRAKWKQLYTAGDVDFRDDGKWPALPPDAAALAARF
jgi:hypothetical protein